MINGAPREIVEGDAKIQEESMNTEAAAPEAANVTPVAVRSDRDHSVIYRVDLDPVRGPVSCTCPGFRSHSRCKHLWRAVETQRYTVIRDRAVSLGMTTREEMDAAVAQALHGSTGRVKNRRLEAFNREAAERICARIMGDEFGY